MGQGGLHLHSVPSSVLAGSATFNTSFHRPLIPSSLTLLSSLSANHLSLSPLFFHPLSNPSLPLAVFGMLPRSCHQ